jgi:membrane protein implicated in regulation of membrane protease activity
VNPDKSNTRQIPVSRIIRRYLLYQIPGISILILLSLFFVYIVDVPVWTVWLLAGAWIIKELVTVPFTWRLYARPRLSPTELMIDQEGIVLEKLDPVGFVKFHSEIWEAEVNDQNTVVEKGTKVRILEFRGMKLIVGKIG